MVSGTGFAVVWVAALLMRSGVATQRVELRNASLTAIPAGESSNLSALILSHNSVAMSASDMKILQGYPGIRELDLSYNRIQSLPAGAFQNLTHLETLSLRGNELRTLHTHIFTGLEKLKSVDLEENPWNCSCSLTGVLQQLNRSGVSTGREVVCPPPQETADGDSFCLNQSNPVRTRPASSPEPSNSSDASSSSRGSSSWKFLLGVVALTLSTSLLIVCAVKSPSWYKLLFNYRHQRLREDGEPSVFSTGRFSNFSLDTQQTETSAQELEEGLDQDDDDDDDGFIEDGYIEPGNYSEPSDAPHQP